MEAHGNGIESSAEVELRGLSIYTHHGVSEAEQEVGQRLEFDISFDVPDCDAVLTDRLEDTIDYGQVSDIVALAATERSYKTLERLAQVVGERLMERYGSETVRVRAAKPEPPLPLAIQEVAVELLGAEGIVVEAVSSTYVTEPVGEVLDQPDFLNAAVRIRTALEPEQLLDACKRVEAERGRTFDAPRHSPRPLDVDLLLLGDLQLGTDRLTLPHREVTTRRFVLVPLLELDPELTLPDGTRLAEALEALPEGQRVERAAAL